MLYNNQDSICTTSSLDSLFLWSYSQQLLIKNLRDAGQSSGMVGLMRSLATFTASCTELGVSPLILMSEAKNYNK
jgi:hypothetical protein